MGSKKSMQSEKRKNKKIFSMKYKLMMVFALMTAVVVAALTIMSVKMARNEVYDRIEAHLEDTAVDASTIIEAKINVFVQYLKGLTELAFLQDKDISFQEKADKLQNLSDRRGMRIMMSVGDTKGVLYTKGYEPVDLSNQDWFSTAMKGKDYISEPFISALTGKLISVVAIPIRNNNSEIVGILNVAMDGLWLTDQIKDITFGKTGSVYVVGRSGVTIADADPEIAMRQENSTEMAKTDSSYETVAKFEQRALAEKDPAVDYFYWKGVKQIASFAKIKKTGWSIIVMAEASEFMGGIDRLRRFLMLLSTLMDIGAIILILIISRRMVRPLQKVSMALKNIAQGDGDLTARLPVKGNDEVTEVSKYFNDTIEKINISIKSVMQNTGNMTQIGQTLSSNMTETASSIHQISSNIEGVKKQVQDQSSGVTETAATMEEIIRTIHSLDGRIASQVDALQDLMKIIDDSNVTTGETRNILDKNDQLIAELVEDSSKGQEVVSASDEEVKNILEESGSLLEASSIIQNIASQTNLLAMNAAIEAAHAGDAGKGFAVVADEIRKLAEESASQAKVITAALKNFSVEIETVSASSSNISESFKSIFEKVNQVKLRSAGIMRIAETRKEQSNKLLTLIQSVDGITSEVKDGSAEMLRGGEQVASEMRNLDELTRVISDSMNEMASGASQINNAVQEVNALTQQNKDSIKNLSDEVNKFRV